MISITGVVYKALFQLEVAVLRRAHRREAASHPASLERDTNIPAAGATAS
jgi:hypothetical protein